MKMKKLMEMKIQEMQDEKNNKGKKKKKVTKNECETYRKYFGGGERQ